MVPPQLPFYSTGAFRQAPPATADLYSLGALAYFLAVGADLGLAEDEVAGPAWGTRAADPTARLFGQLY